MAAGPGNVALVVAQPNQKCRLPLHKQAAISDKMAMQPEVEQATWDSPSDPSNPYNWPSYRKISVACVVSASQLVTTMSATMVTPALPQILHDLDMNTSTGQIAFSVFFLGLGFAPFLVAPLAEMYGRRRVWLAGNAVYILWNSLCPAGMNKGLMIAGRLLAACGASVGVTLTSPVLADMYESKDRGKSIAIAGLIPYVGPALGPIIGGVTAQHVWWPWLFWILSLFDLAVLILGFFIIRETYAPVLLRRKARAAAAIHAAAMGQELQRKDSGTVVSEFWQDFRCRIGDAIAKPIQLLTRRPITLVLALGMAVDFGVYTLVLSTYASLYISAYHESETTASLHYLSIVVGIYLSTQGGSLLMDYMWRRQKAAQPDQEPTPEYRLSYVVVGLVPDVAGTFWYCWAAEKKAHWAMVDAGVVIFTCGNFMFSQGLLAYMVDEFTSKRAASAGASIRVWTYLMGFAFPVFAPELYDNLGYGWGGSLLGLVLLVVGGGVTVVLMLWGRRIREIGRSDYS